MSFESSWALKLFARSPLKQRKLEKIVSSCGNFSAKTCLDIGSDNGVISFKLRELGGLWHSADLIPETVDSIRELVSQRVDQIDGVSTPYQNNFFDLVVIVDFLEHIESDAEFIDELHRILKPGGALVVNVPNPKEGLLRRFQYLIGQTDQAHGHVRPGYNPQQLTALLGRRFSVEQGYSRFFSSLFDTCMTFALDIVKGARGKKGTVVTGKDLAKLSTLYKAYTLNVIVNAIIISVYAVHNHVEAIRLR